MTYSNLAVCADGGLLMNAQAMETAKRRGCPIVAMVWADHDYGQISWKQDNEFHQHTDLPSGTPVWMQLAAAFGWNGYACDDSMALKDTLQQGFASDGPSLVVIPIDYRENPRLTERPGHIPVAL